MSRIDAVANHALTLWTNTLKRCGGNVEQAYITMVCVASELDCYLQDKGLHEEFYSKVTSLELTQILLDKLHTLSASNTNAVN